MRIGDRVRFLSEVGGGRVAGFQGKDIVLVEDEDGFEVPMRKSEVVVVGEENYETKHAVEVKQQQQQQRKQQQAVEKGALDPGALATQGGQELEPADLPITFKAPPQERRGGDLLSAYLAFVPIDIKELSQTRFETYFVNDSNYYLRFVYMTAESGSWHLRATAEVEPNTKAYVEEFGRETLNDMERVCIQMVAYKRDKWFLMKPTVNVQLRIDTVKFYKLHTFEENDFFEQPALIYPVIENDKVARSLTGFER